MDHVVQHHLLVTAVQLPIYDIRNGTTCSILLTNWYNDESKCSFFFG